MQAPRGVNDDHIIAVGPSMAHCRLGNVNGVLLSHRKDGDFNLLTQDHQLLNGRGPVNVCSNQ